MLIGHHRGIPSVSASQPVGLVLGEPAIGDLPGQDGLMITHESVHPLVTTSAASDAFAHEVVDVDWHRHHPLRKSAVFGLCVPLETPLREMPMLGFALSLFGS